MSRRVRNQPDRRPPLACRQLLLPLRRRQILLLLLLFLLMPFPGQVRGEEKRSEQVRITGINRMWGDTEGERTYLEGDLVITKGDTIIHSSFAEVKKTGEGDRDRTAWLKGGVRLVQDELKLAGEEMEFAFEEDWAIFRGDVRLEREEVKNAAGEVEKEGITLSCDYLRIETERKDFQATGNVSLVHKEFTVTAAGLTYEDAGEILFFTGGFFLTRKQDSMKGEELRIDLKEEVFDAQRGVELFFEVEEEGEEEEEEE
jgi:lipopolysaccharide export system protein LptA